MKDVNPQRFVERLSEELKKYDNIKPPQWSTFIKTGVNVERPPQQKDWWYIRSAAILKNVYKNGPVGVQRLRTAFGGKRRLGYKPAHFKRAGGKIIRTMIQQLEKEGFIIKVEKPKRGRIITRKGQSLLDKIERGMK